jgi:hypothetical protein
MNRRRKNLEKGLLDFQIPSIQFAVHLHVYQSYFKQLFWWNGPGTICSPGATWDLNLL